MRSLIKQLAYRVRVFLAPADRHRDGRPELPVQPRAPRPSPARPFTDPAAHPWCEPIDGDSTPLVRPYLDAYERGERARLQRLRRDALWCATYGVDLDTRCVHDRLGAV
ncbi:hypothetical protein [Streptomyces beigongshangae]|uniref:hypothetical protein n=1 Tax=Streptomyces beigongshangae TaxID=2841597 RepID=UPI001C85A44C|nr:hypothetical protein [Streptomyces sp. REN17]